MAAKRAAKRTRPAKSKNTTASAKRAQSTSASTPVKKSGGAKRTSAIAAKAAAKPKPAPKSKAAAKAKPTAKSKTAAKSKPTAKSKTAAKAKPTAKPKTAAKSKPTAKSKTAAKAKRSAAKQPTAGASKAATQLAFRLPEDVRPSHYALHIAVDPQQSREYRGDVEIELELGNETDHIELHAADLRILEAILRTGDDDWFAEVEPQPQRETIVVKSPQPMAAGHVTLKLAFASTLRNDLRGLYGASAGDRQYAFSQLEAADARRFFPCFDEPAFKARFSVSVTTASHNAVVSNGPIERTEQHEDLTTTYFATTPLLSTYLVALAVGELEFSEPVEADGVPIRIVHVPGNGHLTGFALEAARETLTRLADYFGVPYAYEKLDLVAVPDFEIGAMENAGAVFFRETLLLVDENTVSLAEKKRAAEVICHELAHMWYGNLVTMRWWDDLWLNEAFATWMAFDIVAKWRPEWHMWNDFGHSRNSALHLDALDNTHAIYSPVQTPAEATQNFDLITYEKGASVVRMLERYLGPSTFQSGVRTYIERHRESNTQASDLWRALGEAAGESVDDVVRPFIEQPGFPLVTVRTAAANGGGIASVELEQQRFSARGPHANHGNHGNHESTRWAVPWVGRVDTGDDSHTVRALLTGRRARVEIGPETPDFVYGNADEGGFFRPLHPLEQLPALVRALPKLSVSERLGFVHHQWALVRANYLELSGFLQLLPALAGETDADVLRALLGPLEVLVDDIAEAAGGSTRTQLQKLIADTFTPALHAVGFDAAEDETDSVRLRRAELIALCAVVAEDESASELVEERAAAYLDDRSAIDANLVGAVLALGARRADGARLARYFEASQNDATPQERRRFRMALADVRDPELVQDVLRASLTPAIPTQDVALVLARLIANRFAREATFEFVQAHWPELRERMPAMLVSRLVEALPALRTEAHRKQALAFFSANPIPTAARALRQADERFRLAATFRKHAAPELRRWLSKFSGE
jgi:puromycin-sensitive aminopeptidase